MPRRADLRDAALVMGAALAYRAIFLLETRADPFFSILAIDARSYHDLAQRFAGGDVLLGRDALWFAPLYPVVVGTLYAIAGADPSVPILLQHLAGAGSAAIGTILGHRISPLAGRVAGGLLALTPAAVFYESQLLYASLAVLATATFLLAWTRAGEVRRARADLGAGVALGILALLRTNALLFAPVAALGRLVARRPRTAVALLAGVALPLLPVLARNGLVSGAWTPLTVNGGMIFATGFAEDAVGGRALLRTPTDFGPGGVYHREAERAVGQRLDLAEASGWHRRRTLESIARDPGRAARLVVRKAALVANARELEDNLGLPLARARARSLAWLPAPWAFFFVPGAFGAVLALRRRGAAAAHARRHAAFAGVWALSLLPFFVTARYRLPMIVPLAVLAGYAVHSLRPATRPRAAALLLPGMAALVALGLALREPGVRADPALSLSAVGAGLHRAGRSAEALDVLDRALALDPGVAGLHQNRALALLGLGRTGEALAAAREAVRLDSTLAPAWQTVGAILAGEGRVEEALPAFRRAAALAPDDPAALENLARALAATGDVAGAVAVGRRAVEAGAARLAPDVEAWTRAVGNGRAP